MTPKQLAILNALVTYTAENVPGGLHDDERAVARVVGRWALQGHQDDLGVDDEGMGTAPDYEFPAWAIRVIWFLAGAACALAVVAIA